MKEYLGAGILLLGGYLGYKYYKSYKLAENLDFQLVGVSSNGTSNGNKSFQIGLKIKVTNKASTQTTISNSKLKCYVNGRLAGIAQVPYTQVIKANGDTTIYLVCDIFYKNVFSEWWNLFIMSATTINLTIAGSLSFNGIFVPVPQFEIYEFSMKDVIDRI